MNPTKNYNMSKSAKRALCTVVDAHQRAELKAILIQGELHAELKPVKDKKNDRLEASPII